jgi:hypothetical protein
MTTYRFLNAATGKVCCESDRLEYLCEACRHAASIDGYASARGAASAVPDDDPRLTAAARFRAEVYALTSTSVRAAAQPSSSKQHLEAPDPYRLAIEKAQR